jgi:hypothetical protein
MVQPWQRKAAPAQEIASLCFQSVGETEAQRGPSGREKKNEEA